MTHVIRRWLTLCLLVLTPATTGGAWQDIQWVRGFEQGLERARDVGKPAFVYFDAEWCTWCQVYKRETLAAASVHEVLNREFVPVLVDYDARPDLMHRYGGRGLPFTVVLTPDGGLLETVVGILSAADLRRTLLALRDQRPRPRSSPPVTARVDALHRGAFDQFRNAFLRHLERLYDPAVGTLAGRYETGATIKRPAPLTWLYLERRGLWPDRAARAARVERHHLLDPLDGGFFNFLDPYAEDYIETSKLLDANAWLSAWQVGVDRPAGRIAGLSGLYFMEEVLWDPDQGAFWQAQMADPDYYRLDPPQRLKAAPPPVDRLKRTDTNAQAAWALVCLGITTDREGPLRRAARTLDAVLRLMERDGTLYHIRRDGALSVEALPEDLFWLLAAGAAVERVQPDRARLEWLREVSRSATRWLQRRMGARATDRDVPVSLAGLIAWSALHDDLYPALPARTGPWALRQLRIEAETPPDEVVPGLLAWEYALGVHADSSDGQPPACPF